MYIQLLKSCEHVDLLPFLEKEERESIDFLT